MQSVLMQNVRSHDKARADGADRVSMEDTEDPASTAPASATPVTVTSNATMAGAGRLRRESIAHAHGVGGVSWGSFSVGSWLKDEVLLHATLKNSKRTSVASISSNGVSHVGNQGSVGPALDLFRRKSSVFGTGYAIDLLSRNNNPGSLSNSHGHHYSTAPSAASAFLPRLEEQYCKDYSCCGLSLPGLHDLLWHYEEAHIDGVPPSDGHATVATTTTSVPSVMNTTATPSSDTNYTHNQIIQQNLQVKSGSNKRTPSLSVSPTTTTGAHMANLTSPLDSPSQTLRVARTLDKTGSSAINDMVTVGSNFGQSHSHGNLVDAVPTSDVFLSAQTDNTFKHPASTLSHELKINDSIRNMKDDIAQHTLSEPPENQGIFNFDFYSFDANANAISIGKGNKNNQKVSSYQNGSNSESQSIVNANVNNSDTAHNINSQHISTFLVEHGIPQNITTGTSNYIGQDPMRNSVFGDLGLPHGGNFTNDGTNSILAGKLHPNVLTTDDRLEDKSVHPNVLTTDDRLEDKSVHPNSLDVEHNIVKKGKIIPSLAGAPIPTKGPNVKRYNVHKAANAVHQKYINDPARSLYLAEQEENKPFKCPVIGCGKTYKNQNGLKYHKSHGHQNQKLVENPDGTFSILDPESNTLYHDTSANYVKEKPYHCEVCGKRYKNLNGLKYHRGHTTH